MRTSPKSTDYADTLVLPHDELAARRASRRPAPPPSPPSPRELTPEQVQRLLKADELRDR
ncbi:MAG TPA: hypothetical protein VFO94_06160 [Gammaproteobacteria bacterium]|jgi:hypothetical protein|nr:hypothetical protein [Gammaproteobacteria bacterium]